VRIAESQIGQGEHPPGSNCTIYGPCEEWCALFASWVWSKAGIPLAGSTTTYAYSGSLYTWTKEHGGRVLAASATPAPGDLVFYGTGPGPGESKHVGVVQRVFPRRTDNHDRGNYAGHVTLVGPFLPSSPIGERAPIYGYAQPPTTNAPKK
jgi:CHAP domain